MRLSTALLYGNFAGDTVGGRRGHGGKPSHGTVRVDGEDGGSGVMYKTVTLEGRGSGVGLRR